MSVAKVIEVSARSNDSFDGAILEGVRKAGESVHGIKEAWIKDMSVKVDNGRIAEYEVELKVTFVVD